MTLRVGDFAAASDTGRQRQANEDSFFASAPLFAVADGMGGAQAGEVASGLAVEAFKAGLDESLTPERRLAQVVKRANSEIHVMSISKPDYHGMGTTLTAAFVDGSELTIAHVGDSRAYRLRDRNLERLTHDHSLVGEMVRRGALSEEEAEQHPQRSIITRALGPEPDVEVDTHTHSVRAGDTYILCSDGLTAMVSETRIAELANAEDLSSMRVLADRLVREANHSGGIDNITVVAFTIVGAGKNGAPNRAAAADRSRSNADTSDEPALPASAGETIVGAPAVKAAGPATTDGRPPAKATAPASTGGAAYAARQRIGSRKKRLWVTAAITAVVLMIGVAGGLLSARQVYFLGIDEHGLVTVYQGTPYELPMSLHLYRPIYVSIKPAKELTEAERARLLNHKLRGRDDALDLAKQLEQGSLIVPGDEVAPGTTN